MAREAERLRERMEAAYERRSAELPADILADAVSALARLEAARDALAQRVAELEQASGDVLKCWWDDGVLGDSTTYTTAFTNACTWLDLVVREQVTTTRRGLRDLIRLSQELGLYDSDEEAP